MNRRPWPIVILAVIQILSPFFGLLGAALYHGVSMGVLFEESWNYSSGWQKFETYLLPIIVGGLIYFTRRIGYYLALVGCAYIIYRNMVEFVVSEREAPVWMTIIANFIVAGMIVYLLLPKVRMIYLNPALRWWEAAPRFLIAWPARLSRAGEEKTVEAKFHDISIGGAALVCPPTNWLREEELTLQFDHDGSPVQIRGRIVYEKDVQSGLHLIGLKWSENNTNGDRSRIRRLVRTLESGKVPVSRRLPYWWDDFKDWLPRAFSSKEAWIPETKRDK